MTSAALEALRDWKARRDAVLAERDDLIRAAIKAEHGDTEISQESGVSRTTIGQIRNPGGPLALREAARRALRNKGVTVPAIGTTKDGRVLLGLPFDEVFEADLDDDEVEHREALRRWENRQRMDRMNWAGAVLSTLREVGIAVAFADPAEGDTLQEHLAHQHEPRVELSRA